MFDESDFRPSSPVEGDKYLWPDEKPFTDFAAVNEGKIDLRVFEQDVWWVDVKRTPHLLTEMSQDYLFNVLRHVVENAEGFYMGCMLKHAIELTMTVFTPSDEAVCEYLDNKPSLHGMTPIEWVTSTPLVTKIYELLDNEKGN